MDKINDLIILGHKIQAIRDLMTRSLDALAAEVAAKVPREATLKRNRPDPVKRLRAIQKARLRARTHDTKNSKDISGNTHEI